mmetsp:Transcript_63104/g.110142  ORF Transcript_63104/g.110142 Transcript_63104/m.110142 type:complete len:191 (-) Transcript_63104:248-820(-)
MQIKVAASLLACLAVTSSSSSLPNAEQSKQLDSLAKLLLASEHTAAFKPSGSLASSEGASRRAAIANIATAATALAAVSLMPQSALADAADDEIMEIARRSNAEAKRLREEEAALYNQEVPEVSTEDKLKPILGVAAVGILLSLPSYLNNLKRVTIKVASGGKDSGYDTAGPSYAEKFAKNAGSIFFNRK